MADALITLRHHDGKKYVDISTDCRKCWLQKISITILVEPSPYLDCI